MSTGPVEYLWQTLFNDRATGINKKKSSICRSVPIKEKCDLETRKSAVWLLVTLSHAFTHQSHIQCLQATWRALGKMMGCVLSVGSCEGFYISSWSHCDSRVFSFAKYVGAGCVPIIPALWIWRKGYQEPQTSSMSQVRPTLKKQWQKEGRDSFKVLGYSWNKWF